MAAAESSTSEDRTCPQRHSRPMQLNRIGAREWERRIPPAARRRWKLGHTELNRQKSWLTCRSSPSIRLIPIDSVSARTSTGLLFKLRYFPLNLAFLRTSFGNINSTLMFFQGISKASEIFWIILIELRNATWGVYRCHRWLALQLSNHNYKMIKCYQVYSLRIYVDIYFSTSRRHS